jgi:phosphate uptake regulator
MDIRKMQRSGSTYYIYLPASWCKENNITTKSIVYLDKTPDGGLLVNVEKKSAELTSLSLELSDNTPSVINKMIISSYINPVRKFDIKLQTALDPDQVLDHKRIFGGLDFLEFNDKNISCNTTIMVDEPDFLLSTMIKKITSIIRLIREDSAPELVTRYEEEIDKSNLLIMKAIITSLLHKKTLKLRHIDLYYIGSLSKTLEQITDNIIRLGSDDITLEQILPVLRKLDEVLARIDQASVVSFIRQISRLERSTVTDTRTYYRASIISLLEEAGAVLSDWMITKKIDSTVKQEK